MSNVIVTTEPVDIDPAPQASDQFGAPAIPFAIDAEPTPAPSPLDGLKAKLAEASRNLTIDVEVPRWPELMGLHVFVRYAPLSPAYAAKVSEQFAKTKADEWTIQANAQMLVKSCRGVYVQTDDGSKLSFRVGDPDGAWTKFDHDLGEALGETVQDAVAVCRKLYFTDGDLVAACGHLAEWSAKATEEEAADFPTP